jgi:RNA polymerase sigma-70 factor, ECF subfamily
MIEPTGKQRTADRELMELIAKGDQAAFSTLYDRLSAPLFSLALEMLRDANEAEDTLQEVCLQVWRRAATYDATRSSLFSWAVMMTRSKAIDRLRARGRRARIVAGSTDENPESFGALASEADNAADTSEKNDEANRVRTALRTLPDEQRQAIELAFFSHMTQAEIAAQKGEPLGTVKARIRRGLLRLRDGLK